MKSNEAEKFLVQDKAIGNPTYLIVADDTQEFDNALQYACYSAKRDNAYVGVLYVIPEAGFFHWGNIEARINKDRRQDAEQLLQKMADKIRQVSGLTASLYVGEGDRAQAVIKTLNDNPHIIRLILGGSTKAGGPGPLVSFFVGKGISKLPVPLTIVPDNIALEKFGNFT